MHYVSLLCPGYSTALRKVHQTAEGGDSVASLLRTKVPWFERGVRVATNTGVRNNPRMIARVLAAAALALTALVAAPSTASADSVTFADADGIHVVSNQQLDDRLWALTVSSDALGRTARVRILPLPDGS